MAAERATGLVVRASKWSESSCIVTLWTREFGKIRALAKGGRRLKSNFEVALDLLTNCDMVLHRKATSGLDLLTEARVRERYPALRSVMTAFYAGCYVAELLADGTADHDPHPDLYDEAVWTLRGLGQNDDGRLVAAFELTLLRILGHGPELEACAGCGNQPDAIFSALAGGVVCATCATGYQDGRRLADETLTILRELQKAGVRGCWSPPTAEVRGCWSPPTAEVRGCGSPPTINAITGPNWSSAVQWEVRQVLGAFITCRWGRRPRLLAYVEGA